MSKFVLTTSEINEPGMRRLMAHLDERLVVKRGMLEQRKPQDETDYLRGEIAQLRAIASLASKNPATG